MAYRFLVQFVIIAKRFLLIKITKSNLKLPQKRFKTRVQKKCYIGSYPFNQLEQLLKFTNQQNQAHGKATVIGPMNF